MRAVVSKEPCVVDVGQVEDASIEQPEDAVIKTVPGLFSVALRSTCARHFSPLRPGLQRQLWWRR